MTGCNRHFRPRLVAYAALGTCLSIVAAGRPLPAQQMKQIADPDFDAAVARPAFAEHHPRVLFDEAHFNRHTTAGRYKPFADLIANDGFHITANRRKFSQDTLSNCDVLVIANAMAGKEASTKPAFGDDECEAVGRWVRGGGALLLVADHAPYGSAAKNLANTFGVDMRDGYTKDAEHCYRQNRILFDWQLVFTRDNRLLADHPITRGRNRQEYLQRVMTFGGQSLKGPDNSTAILKLADTAFDHPSFNSRKTTPAAGRAQAVAFPFGKGRVVVLGEAAVLTAQVLWIEGQPPQSHMGMNVAGFDNRQFTLNIMHWLAGILDEKQPGYLPSAK